MQNLRAESYCLQLAGDAHRDLHPTFVPFEKWIVTLSVAATIFLSTAGGAILRAFAFEYD